MKSEMLPGCLLETNSYSTISAVFKLYFLKDKVFNIDISHEGDICHLFSSRKLLILKIIKNTIKHL